MNVCSPLMSDMHSAEALKPTQGTFDDPTPPVRHFARLYVISHDLNCNMISLCGE